MAKKKSTKTYGKPRTLRITFSRDCGFTRSIKKRVQQTFISKKTGKTKTLIHTNVVDFKNETEVLRNIKSVDRAKEIYMNRNTKSIVSAVYFDEFGTVHDLKIA